MKILALEREIHGAPVGAFRSLLKAEGATSLGVVPAGRDPRAVFQCRETYSRPGAGVR
jgi:hypothetical protein